MPVCFLRFNSGAHMQAAGRGMGVDGDAWNVLLLAAKVENLLQIVS